MSNISWQLQRRSVIVFSCGSFQPPKRKPGILDRGNTVILTEERRRSRQVGNSGIISGSTPPQQELYRIKRASHSFHLPLYWLKLVFSSIEINISSILLPVDPTPSFSLVSLNTPTKMLSSPVFMSKTFVFLSANLMLAESERSIPVHEREPSPLTRFAY